MAETTQQQQGQQQGSMEGSYRPQEQYDADFVSQMLGGQHALEVGREFAQSYFDLAEQTIRTARRVTEAQALHVFRQQIVSDVTGQVISQIRKNPSWIQQNQS